ncbi:MAG: oligosaccharide flippase family protein [Propylenella sp.]
MWAIFVNLARLGGMQMVIALTAIVRTKVLAVKLGAEGYGEFSQVVLLALSASTIATFGLGISLSRNVAAAKDHAERQRLLDLSNAVNLFISAACIGVAAPILITRPEVLGIFGIGVTPTALTAVLVVALFIPINAAVTHRVAFLTAVQDINGLTSGRSLALLLGTAVSIPIVWYWGIVGAAVQLLMLTAFVLAALDIRCRRIGFRPYGISFDSRGAAATLALGIVSLIDGAADQLSNLVVRSSLMNALGAAENGHYQAAIAVLNQFGVVVLSSIGGYAIATLSRDPSRANVTEVSNQLLSVVLPIAAAGFAMLGLFSGPAIHLFYSADFLPAQSLFPYLVSAEFLHVAIWTMGSPLLAQNRMAAWLMLDFVFFGVRLLAALGLLPIFGIDGVAIGYAIATAIHLVLTWLYFNHLGFAVSGQNVGLLLTGAAMTLVLAYAGSQVEFDAPLYLAGLAVAAGFMLLSIHWLVGIGSAWGRVRRALGRVEL